MAVIHHTTLKPTKLELLTAWLPTRTWYHGGAGEPELAKAGGFRLDDPEGEVGIEFMVVTDTATAQPVTYLVPLTYRGAPLTGMEHALVGTMDHGVLGRRWAYDGFQDPVLVAQLLALIEGRVEAQAQSESDTPDRDVTRTFIGGAIPTTDFVTGIAFDDNEGTELSTPSGEALRLRRVLYPAPNDTSLNVLGDVTASWHQPDGTRKRGTIAVLHTRTGA